VFTVGLFFSAFTAAQVCSEVQGGSFVKTLASVLGVLAILCLFFSGIPCPAFAVWLEGGNPVCTALENQNSEEIVSDGAGGAIIAWYDCRAGSWWDSYVQRIRADGTPAWTIDGVPVCNVHSDHYGAQPVSDGAGGAIVVWQDGRNGKPDIYAQRILADGTVAWAASGVPVSVGPGAHGYHRVVSDGAGGAVIVFEDSRSGTWDIYAQRINGSGSVVWPADVPLCTASGEQHKIRVASDGAGGAVAAWQDGHGADLYDVYAQRVSAGGVAMWGANGVAVCVGMREQFDPTVTSDGAGGAIIAWQDGRSSYWDIYAQRIDAGGTAMWTENGVGICTASYNQYRPQITTDGAGGAIIAWDDARDASQYDIYVRRVTAGGTPLWTANGVLLCSAIYDQKFPQITSDGAGGASVTWTDWRSGTIDIYAHRVGGDGTLMWNANGVRLSKYPANEFTPQIASDGSGGAIVAWVQYGGETTVYDIYAQRVDASGIEGPTPVMLAGVSARAEKGCVALSWRVIEDVPASSFVVRRSESPDGGFVQMDVSVVRGTGLSFSCADCSAQPGRTYWYEIVLVGTSGYESSGRIEVYVESAPVAFRVYESYPNPFNPVCTIRYDIPQAGRVTLTVLDVKGSSVRTLVDGWREPGAYKEVWDGRADNGNTLPSGVYFYWIKAGDLAAGHKMVLLK